MVTLIASALTTGCGVRRHSQPPPVPMAPGTFYKGPYSWGDAVQPAVPDGTVVLVKKGKALGAFILRNQRTDGRGPLIYDYCYRTDGRGEFNRCSLQGCVCGSKRIPAQYNAGPDFQVVVFGPFRIPWSANDNGKGWLYYPRRSGEKVAPGDLQICVTSESDMKRINATDSKWIYRGSPSDPGVTATLRK